MGDYNQMVECFFCRQSIPLAATRRLEDSSALVCEDTENCDEAINAAINAAAGA